MDYPHGKHPNSLANLKPSKPGEVRNPKGRPKGYTIKELVRKYLDEHPDDMKAFVQHFVKENRDLSWRMLEGNPPQPLEHAGEISLPMRIIEIEPGLPPTKEGDSGTRDQPRDSTG